MSALADYIAALDRAYRRGDATEHGYRPALKALLECRAGNVEATNEPQRIAGNAPDFVVRCNATILGHVECKDIGEPLDKLLKSEQLKRYAGALPNLVSADYPDFTWLEHGEVKLRVQLGHATPHNVVATDAAGAEWAKLADAFCHVHYRQVVVALARTRELMRQVDGASAPLWASAPEGAAV